MHLRSHILYMALIGLSILFSCFQAHSALADKIIVKHYQSQARYIFGHELLVLALTKVDKNYQIQTFPDQLINEARGEKMLLDGEFDVQWLSTSQKRESKLLAIKIPIYKGILGLRLLLVKHQNFERMSKISSLKDLQNYTGGHGSHWADLPVYQANQLPVHTHAKYDPLFLQLANDRFDYFHRGLNEIWAEQKKYSSQLVIAEKVMLYYPHPVYFFVNKENPELARDIENGLAQALHDGSYKALFLQHHSDLIKKGDLKNRKLIRLTNPNVPATAPSIDTHWWLPD